MLTMENIFMTMRCEFDDDDYHYDNDYENDDDELGSCTTRCNDNDDEQLMMK